MDFVRLPALIYSLRAFGPPTRKPNQVQHLALEACPSVEMVPLQKTETDFLKVGVRKTSLNLQQNLPILIYMKVPAMT